MHLLLIEDEAGSSGMLADRLMRCGFKPQRVSSAQAAIEAAKEDRAAALVYDQSHNGLPAAIAVRPLRDAGVELPLIVLSPRGDWRDKVESLDAGADDYLVKPIHSEEVAARLRAVIRRTAGLSSDRIRFGNIEVGLKARCAWLEGQCLNLTRSEFALLRQFMLRKDDTLTRDEIGAAVSAHETLSPNAVEVLITRLRRKLGPDRIRTVRGIGYRLVALDGDDSIENEPEDCKRCAPA